jgi:hypothetical protein
MNLYELDEIVHHDLYDKESFRAQFNELRSRSGRLPAALKHGAIKEQRR